MKKSLPFFLLIFILLLIPSSVGAQGPATTSANPRLETMELKANERMERMDARAQKLGTRLDMMREKFASRTAALKEKLSLFRDKNKARRVETVNGRLLEINEKRTGRMEEHLTKLSSLLTKVEEKLSGAENATEAETAVADAKAKIDLAKEAVASQSAKDYTIEATSEGTIKADSLKARMSLFEDLNAVHKLIVDARQAVASAISSTVSALGGSNGQ